MKTLPQLKIYWPFAKANIQEFMTYRLNFYIFIAGELLQTVFMLYIWRAVFASSSSAIINGFTLRDMVTYIFISTITGMIIQNDIHWAIGNDVRTGEIAMNLIKPVSYQLRQYASAVGNIIINLVFIALPLWIGYTTYEIIANNNWPQIDRIVFFIISCTLSSLILFAINYAFGLAAFYVNYIFGFIYAKETIFRFFSGAVIPLAFFPQGLIEVFNFLPFGSLIYTPVMIYLGKYSGNTMWQFLGIQLIWVILMFALDHILWTKSIKRLSILGG